MATFGERLDEALRLRGISPAELSKKTGIGEGAISQYRKGAYKATQRNLEKIATALHVSIPWLMGAQNDSFSNLPSNITTLTTMNKVPLVGQIACGTPILAEQNIEDYIDLPGHIHADYALACKGDSMINAGIQNGDIVYIRQQKQVLNGQIAAVMVGNEEATLKRLYFENGVVQLVSENPAIPPKVYIGQDIEQLNIIGLAVAYTHMLEQNENNV